MADLGVARAEPVLPGPARPAHGQHDVGRAAQVEQDAGGWLGIAPLVVARSGTDQPTAGSGSIRQRRCPGLGDAMAADPGLRVADQGPGPHWDGSTGQRSPGEPPRVHERTGGVGPRRYGRLQPFTSHRCS